jgi:hypothetical protein
MGLVRVVNNADALNEVNPAINASANIPPAEGKNKLPHGGERNPDNSYITTNVTEFTPAQRDAIREAAVKSGGKVGGNENNVTGVEFHKVKDGTVTIEIQKQSASREDHPADFLASLKSHKDDFAKVQTKHEMGALSKSANANLSGTKLTGNSPEGSSLPERDTGNPNSNVGASLNNLMDRGGR